MKNLIKCAASTVAVVSMLALAGCATEKSRSIEIPKVAAASPSAPIYQGPKSLVAVGKFDNRSNFMRGMFTDAVDRLGSQSKTILISHLQQTQRFSVLDRDNLEESKQEAQYKAANQAIKGADFLVTGAVTEFGRKEVGDQQLFGLLGRGKSQVAYAKVTLNIVNSLTSELVFSSQGAGEFSLDSREVLGTGGTQSYDATLNGKVLDLAIREAVNNLVVGIDAGALRTAR